jgi:hypothetical protein
MEVFSEMLLLRACQLPFAGLSGQGRKSLGGVILFANLLLPSSMCAQTAQRPHTTGISHIAVFAHDYEKSRAFYGTYTTVNLF